MAEKTLRGAQAGSYRRRLRLATIVSSSSSSSAVSFFASNGTGTSSTVQEPVRKGRVHVSTTITTTIATAAAAAFVAFTRYGG